MEKNLDDKREVGFDASTQSESESELSLFAGNDHIIRVAPTMCSTKCLFGDQISQTDLFFVFRFPQNTQ